MPEVPGAETIKEDRARVHDASIGRSDAIDERLVEESSIRELAVRMWIYRRAIDSTYRRRGKQLVLHLEGGKGFFLLGEIGSTRARLLTDEILENQLAALGTGPLGGRFSVECLRQATGNRRAQINPLILNQSITVGVDNISTEESLYDARIHLRCKASSLSGEDWGALYGALRENLETGLEHRGTTFNLYIDVPGHEDRYQHCMKDLLREGKPSSVRRKHRQGAGRRQGDVRVPGTQVRASTGKGELEL